MQSCMSRRFYRRGCYYVHLNGGKGLSEGMLKVFSAGSFFLDKRWHSCIIAPLRNTAAYCFRCSSHQKNCNIFHLPRRRPMADLSWIPRESKDKNHYLWGEAHFGTAPPSVIYEKRPILDPEGKAVEGLYSAWIILNNPKQFNSYTTGMVKGVIAGFNRASVDNSVVAAIFTAVGDKAFCTGGDTREDAEYYAGRPNEYGLYMDLFIAMVDGILGCKKPTICRVNGMRVAGGQEIGMACDLTITSDLAIFGQAGPRHGSAPDGGSTDFLPWMLPMELAIWNCVSCELWSAYKMKRLGLVSQCLPGIRDAGKWVRTPAV